MSTRPAPFELERDTRQGSPASGLLFTVRLWGRMREIISEWHQRKRRFQAGQDHMHHLGFAYDVVIIGKDSEEALEILSGLEEGPWKIWLVPDKGED